MPDLVHVFISTGRFKSFDEMREYIDETYTEDGDGIDSPFMKEVELEEYEPGCIEAIPSESGAAEPLSVLLANASYGDQWLSKLPANLTADAAICVFPPNVLGTPQGCSLQYVGGFEFEVQHPDWFQRILRDESPEG